MRWTDVIFFSIIGIYLFLISLMIFEIIPVFEYFQFSGLLLMLPIVIIKIFFRKSRAYKWLEKERWLKDAQ